MIRSAAVAALALAALSAAPAAAQPYDPRLGWRTVETAHFRVHFHDDLGPLARRVAGAAERAHQALVPRFAHAPAGRTEVVLSDDVDDANGSATPLPYNTVRLYAVQPDPFSELDDERDWLEALVTHEYVHILHLDTVEGVPAALNAVFGKVMTPSGYAPSFLVEGLAVLHEGGDARGDGGRNENALFDMYARALALEGPFPRLDEVVHQPLTWPRGNMAYLLGGRFFAFVRERRGAAAITAFSKDQGAQLWPYRFDTLAERHLGGGLPELWDAFQGAVRARAEDEVRAVRARPVTAARPLTRRGSRVLQPRWLPSGQGLVFFDQGTEERAGLRRVSLAGEDGGRLADVEGDGSFGLRGAGEAVVAATDVHREFMSRADLRLVDLATGRQRRLTSGERATGPDLSPDGMTVVYAARLAGGETALRKLRLDGGAPETVWSAPGVQVSAPRWAPDGRRIAFAVQEEGRRDVAVWEAGEVAFVTDDDAIDLAPAWSPDGGTIFFSSERSGIYDVYAFELDATAAGEAGRDRSPSASPPRRHLPGRLRQVTNVEMGAFQPEPSPDGRTLAFLTYSRRGYDLAVMPLERAAWLEPSPARERPLRGPGAPRPPAPPVLADRPYRATDTVLPTFWLPFLGADGAGTTLGAITGGADALLQHAYALQAWYGVASREPGYAVDYVGGWLYPRLTLSSSRFVGTTPGTPGLPEEQWVPLSGSLVFTKSHVDRSHALTVGFRALRLRAEGGAPTILPAGVEPYRDGTASEISLALAYQDARRFVSSISPEEGRVLGLSFRWASPSLGGTFSYARARAAAAEYLRLPWTRHAVLALRGSVGLASGTLGGRQPFTLGGPSSADLAALALAPLLGPALPPDLLRGYPSGAFAGSTLLNASAELRFPLARLERGLRAWPVQLRRLSGSVFLDAGGAFAALGDGQRRALGSDDRLRFGAGGELVGEVVLGYFLRTDVRLGVARGLGRLLASGAPADPLATTQVYLVVGPSF